MFVCITDNATLSALHAALGAGSFIPLHAAGIAQRAAYGLSYGKDHGMGAVPHIDGEAEPFDGLALEKIREVLANTRTVGGTDFMPPMYHEELILLAAEYDVREIAPDLDTAFNLSAACDAANDENYHGENRRQWDRLAYTLSLAYPELCDRKYPEMDGGGYIAPMNTSWTKAHIEQMYKEAEQGLRVGRQMAAAYRAAMGHTS